MRFVSIITSLFMLLVCWLVGVEMGMAETMQQQNALEKPYRMVMDEAVERLIQAGYDVKYPAKLPMLHTCSSCLNQHEAFGAYIEATNAVIMPDDFDMTSTDGHAALIHEYGHYLLTQEDIPETKQERICLMLGNSVYQKFFTASLER